jgi:hypothetical protein
LPLPQRCTSTAHKEETLLLSLLPSPWLLPLLLPLPSLLLSPTPLPLPLTLPLPLPSPSAIAVAVTITHCRCRLCPVTVSHCRHRCCCHQPLLSLSQSVITVAISVSHHHCHRRQPLPRVVALVRQELYSNNLSKECLPNFIFLDSGRRTDQSRMTDQASSGDGQHQRWAERDEQQAASRRSGWQQGGSRV